MQGDGALNIAGGQTVAVVPEGWTIASSLGTVTLNNGVIKSASGAGVTTNNGTVIRSLAPITTNNGSVGMSSSTITTNASGGVVDLNTGTVTTNASGGTVNLNVGTVTTNASGGVVLHNYGTIGTDNGESDVPRVTLNVTTTTNTDMVGTDNAATAANLGTPVALDGGSADIAGMLTKMADDNGGADFDATTDSLQAIRDRGDAAWTSSGLNQERWSKTETNWTRETS